MRRLLYTLNSQVIYLNYKLHKFQKIIWIVGDGRSGTTWLLELLNVERTYRAMFEPFHPIYVEQMKTLQPYQYARPHEPNAALHRLAESVFTGQLRHPFVDATNRRLRYKGLVIKDIFANLFVK